jgi:hypothetical protein
MVFQARVAHAVMRRSQSRLQVESLENRWCPSALTDTTTAIIPPPAPAEQTAPASPADAPPTTTTTDMNATDTTTTDASASGATTTSSDTTSSNSNTSAIDAVFSVDGSSSATESPPPTTDANLAQAANMPPTDTTTETGCAPTSNTAPTQSAADSGASPAIGDAGGSGMLVPPQSGGGDGGAVGTGSDGGTSNAGSPVYVMYTYTKINDTTVEVSGMVIGDNVASATVTFSGAVNDTIQTDASGYFDAIEPVSQLGDMVATAHTTDGRVSDPVSQAFTNDPPRIDSFYAYQIGIDRWTFAGHVTNESPELTINFSGSVLDGQSTQSDFLGRFTLTVDVAAGTCGEVIATTTDAWGASSGLCYDFWA